MRRTEQKALEKIEREVLLEPEVVATDIRMPAYETSLALAEGSGRSTRP